MEEAERPAFYALSPGGWRDYWTLFHPPYTVWHLSYVAFGASVAPVVDGRRLGATLAAFALGVGVTAHALDELNGRPLRTRIPDRVLWVLALVGLAGAVAIGVAGAVETTPWLLPLVAFGAFIVLAYNLETFGGRFHSDGWFAASWGGFPAVTAYVAQAERIRVEALAVAAACVAISMAQRRLSTSVRDLRRRTRSVQGVQVMSDGTERSLTEPALRAAPEAALRALSAGMGLLALGLLVFRLS